MANPFTTGPFNCCTCPEPPDYDSEVDDPLDKYINTCGCPSVSVVCESSEKTATLCGFSENTAFTSTPPKKYLKKELKWTQYNLSNWECGQFNRPCGRLLLSTTSLSNGSFRIDEYTDIINEVEDASCTPYTTYPTPGCSYGQRSYTSYTYKNPYVSCPKDEDGNRDPGCVCARESTSVTECIPNLLSNQLTDVSATVSEMVYSSQAYFGSGDCSGELSQDWNARRIKELSIEDTDDAALERATATEGSSCSSLYQLRTTSFSFTKRTATYTATASNLVVGKAYTGCVRIRKREAYSGTPPAGADTEWEDVEPDTISSFTATDTEEEIATDVVVPNVQGYEYQVVSAHVWPVSVGCDCPTSYAP